MTYTQAQIEKANAVDLEKFLRAQGETLVPSPSSTSEKVRMGRLLLSVPMGQPPSFAVGGRMVILPSTAASTTSCSRKYSIRIS